MSGGISGVGVSADKIVNQQEAEQHLAADGKPAPEGTRAVPVGAGETISKIMHDHGLDWNNPKDRAQFLKDNPQFTDQSPPPAGLRSADLIYPEERIYVRDPAANTDAAASDYRDAKGMHAERDSQISNKNQQLSKAEDDFKKGVASELAHGASPEDIKARYPNDPDLSKMVDEVVATSKAAADLADAKAMPPGGNDTLITAKDERVAKASAALEQSVRNELRANELSEGTSPEAIKERLKNDPNVKLDDATIDKIVDAASKPASASNPVGGEAAKQAPLSPMAKTNEAAAKVAEHPKDESLQKAFISQAKAELDSGVTVQELKERYGNDYRVSQLIDQAAKQ